MVVLCGVVLDECPENLRGLIPLWWEAGAKRPRSHHDICHLLALWYSIYVTRVV